MMKKYKFKKDFGIDYRAGDRLEDGTWLLKEPLIKEGFIEEIKEQSLAEKMLSSGELTFLTGHDKERAKKLSNLAISEVLKVFDDACAGNGQISVTEAPLILERVRKAIESMKGE